YEVGLDAKVPYLVMEFVPGGTLTDLFRDPEFPKPFPWRTAAQLLVGMARGLGAAHRQGIIHRDVKPDNVLLTARRDGIAKIADFGIAKLAGETPITRTGLIVGTVGYLSPEQAMGRSIDARS